MKAEYKTKMLFAVNAKMVLTKKIQTKTKNITREIERKRGQLSTRQETTQFHRKQDKFFLGETLKINFNY